jgi:hypothetical protein
MAALVTQFQVQKWRLRIPDLLKVVRWEEGRIERGVGTRKREHKA